MPKQPTEGIFSAASSLFLHWTSLKSADPSTESFHTTQHLDQLLAAAIGCLSGACLSEYKEDAATILDCESKGDI